MHDNLFIFKLHEILYKLTAVKTLIKHLNKIKLLKLCISSFGVFKQELFALLSKSMFKELGPVAKKPVTLG